MHRQHQDVLPLAQRAERRPQQPAGREVEGDAAPRPSAAAGPPPPARPPAALAGRPGGPRTDAPDRRSGTAGPRRCAEARAQRLVARARTSVRARSRAAGVELAGQPHRLRAGCRPASPAPAGRGTRAAAGRRRAAARRSARPSQGGDPRARARARARAASTARARPATVGRLEQAPQRQLDAEGGADPRHHLGGQQRVAAEREEVVRARPTRSTPQHLGPDPRQQLLDRAAGRRVAGRRGRRRLGRRQRLAVHLAVGRQRQRLQGHEGRRHHVLRQRSPEALPQLGRGRAPRRRRPGRPPAACRPPSSRTATTACRTAGWPAERRLDLPQLDAEAAHLHLVVDAAQELQLARRPVARQVARAVEPAPRLAPKGSGTNRSAVRSGRPR